VVGRKVKKREALGKILAPPTAAKLSSGGGPAEKKRALQPQQQLKQ
jgi:hypothetical protein